MATKRSTAAGMDSQQSQGSQVSCRGFKIKYEKYKMGPRLDSKASNHQSRN
ncbi:MAG TPA: hypothetical protein VKA40_08805 [Nitrososphaera sp.]|nr:hypothetical protein [Nitrososphaera sp.]